jgi:hypothetical protein
MLPDAPPDTEPMVKSGADRVKAAAERRLRSTVVQDAKS